MGGASVSPSSLCYVEVMIKEVPFVRENIIKAGIEWAGMDLI